MDKEEQDQNKDQEEELVVIEDPKDPDEGKEDLDEDHDDDSEDSSDEGKEESRLGASDEDEESDEEKKSRRREENKERKRRQKEARERNKREMDFLRTRNEELERRQSAVETRVGQTEVSNVDQKIAQINKNLKVADEVMQRAVEQQKGQDFVEAQKIRDDLRDDLNKLNYYKGQLTDSHQRKPEATRQPDPELANHAKKWMDENTWWNPQGTDQDSLMVTAIDNALAQENYNPRTPEYWAELSRRVQKQLPQHFEDTNTPAKKPSKRGGPKLSTGGQQRELKKNEIYISPERRNALEEAGVWDDPVLRQKYLKRYQSYDREHKSNA